MPAHKKTSYLGNTQLKAAGVKTEFTLDQLREWKRCYDDPEYFIENYVKIISLDKGVVKFKLRKYQRNMVRTFLDNRFSIVKMPRQCGKSTTTVAILLYLVIFRDEFSIGIFANKAKTAAKLLNDLKKMYIKLPKWLQQGVQEWNKTSIELDNGSKVLAFSTASDSGRSESFNFILMDEFAHVPSETADAFLAAVYPTISSGTQSKMVIISTPNGYNSYYKLWESANYPRDSKDPQCRWNEFVPLSITWRDVPGRDDKWKAATIARIGPAKFRQEFDCEFLGSSGTLIDPDVLNTIVPKPALAHKILKYGGTTEPLDIYRRPSADRQYVLIADVADGKGQDYSAFTIIDISEIPYRVVAKYRSNLIKTIMYADVIFEAATLFNEAWVLVEINELGREVVQTLHQDLEYENILTTKSAGRGGGMVLGGYGKSSELGLRTNKATKRHGCIGLKTLIEGQKLLFEDFHIFEELTRFVDNGRGSYEAESGGHDDLVMTLVHFGWMVNQAYFKDLTDTDIYAKFKEDYESAIEEDVMPVGVFTGVSEDPWEDGPKL